MSDWDTVTVLRKRAPKASAMKSETAVNQARRQGVAVDTTQKCKWPHRRRVVGHAGCIRIFIYLFFFTVGAGTNKQHITTKNTAKLDRESEELKHDKVPLDVGKIIQQGRNAKGLSQKDLATVCLFFSFLFAFATHVKI